MGFLKPKMPPPPPAPPTPPVLPPANVEQMTQRTKNKLRQTHEKRKRGYTETILTSTEGDTETPEIYKKTLLGA
tara:strand:- start:6115 stop:6336 length:222 start_codon:yes stop_codon:yes gene_type:complete